MGAMISAADVVRRHRMGSAVILGVALVTCAVCIAVRSNAWTNATVAVLGALALTELVVAKRFEGLTEAATLRREIHLMRWAPLWYGLPMTAAPLLMVEGASRMVGEHAPLPIVVAVVAVGVGAMILTRVAMHQLERQLS